MDPNSTLKRPSDIGKLKSMIAAVCGFRSSRSG